MREELTKNKGGVLGHILILQLMQGPGRGRKSQHDGPEASHGLKQIWAPGMISIKGRSGRVGRSPG